MISMKKKSTVLEHKQCPNDQDTITYLFIISQNYYELPKETTRANGNIYHILKANNFLDVRNIYQDKVSMDMTIFENKYLTSTC